MGGIRDVDTIYTTCPKCGKHIEEVLDPNNYDAATVERYRKHGYMRNIKRDDEY